LIKPNFRNEEIYARLGRPNQRAKRLPIHFYGYPSQTKVVAIIGQHQESACQLHLAGIEHLVDQVRLNSGPAGQKMAERIVGKLLVLEKEANYDFSL
jgi:hypothetical protein